MSYFYGPFPTPPNQGGYYPQPPFPPMPSNTKEAKKWLRFWKDFEKEMKKTEEEDKKKKDEKAKAKPSSVSPMDAFLMLTVISPLIGLGYMYAMVYAFTQILHMAK